MLLSDSILYLKTTQGFNNNDLLQKLNESISFRNNLRSHDVSVKWLLKKKFKQERISKYFYFFPPYYVTKVISH